MLLDISWRCSQIDINISLYRIIIAIPTLRLIQGYLYYFYFLVKNDNSLESKLTIYGCFARSFVFIGIMVLFLTYKLYTM